MDIEEKFWQIAKIEYPTNEAGGTGRILVSKLPDNKIWIRFKEYGCNYNQPYIVNKEQVIAVLGDRIIFD